MVLLSLAGVLAGCKPAARPPLDFAVYLTCDTHGRLVPCGCFTGQYGGLTRLRTVLEREKEPVHLRVDAGDALGGTEDYHQMEYRYLQRAYASMQFDALNLGHREAQLSRDQLKALGAGTPVPMISANLLDAATGQPLFPPYCVLEKNGWRFGIVGVMDPAGLGDQLGEGLAVEKMEPALSRILPELKSKSDVILLLAFANEEAMARLAAEFYEADLILGGKVRQPSQQLERVNRSWIYYVTNESRALAILRLRLEAPGRLSHRSHEIRLLTDRIPEHPEIRKLAEAYRQEVRQARLDVDSPERLQENFVPGVRLAALYVGSENCLDCHPSAAKSWKKSGHAHAFETLVNASADMDPKCIGCHTVGFTHPSGYRREYRGKKLGDVGCESCHGPGSLHVRQHRDGEALQFKFRPLGAGDCQKCHYGEFSRPFQWETFWPRVQHGLEPRTALRP